MARYQIDNIPYPIDFQGSDMRLRTLQNAKNLLMCQMGEVPYDRCRGFDAALYDLPVGEMRAALLPELDRLMIYEPDVEVVSADASLMDDGRVYIQVIIDLPDEEE